MIRNQRHGEFMDESSIFLELHGLSSSGMALGKVLGFARDEKTKTHKRHNIASDHLKRAEDMACKAIKRVIKNTCTCYCKTTKIP
jgi:5'(3')-deoxyribonucleotidase